MSEAHGMSKTPEYRAWAHMKGRCLNEGDDRYKYYGARGITICQEWVNSFSQFYKDMGERPSSRHSIERDDVDGNYEPSNCRWATSAEQVKNRRPFTYTEETRKKQSLERRGKKKPEGFGGKISLAMKGNTNSLGRVLSKETRGRIGESVKATNYKKYLTRKLH